MVGDDESVEGTLREAVFDRDGQAPQPTELLNLDISVTAAATDESRELLDQIWAEQGQVATVLAQLREQAFADGRSVFDESIDDAIDQLTTSVSKDQIILPPAVREQTELNSCSDWASVYTNGLLSLERGEQVNRSSLVDRYDLSNDTHTPTALSFGCDQAVVIESSSDRFLVLQLPDSDREITLELSSDLPDLWEEATYIYLKPVTREGNPSASPLVEARREFEVDFYVEKQRVYRENPDEEIRPDQSDLQALQLCMDSSELDCARFTALLDVLEGNLSATDYRRVLLLMAGARDAVLCSYQHPQIVAGFAEVVGAELTPIPQQGRVILSLPRVDVPIDLASDFPEKQSLTDDELRTVASIVGQPDTSLLASSAVDSERAEILEHLFRCYESGDIGREDITAYRYATWIPAAERDAILEAIEAGREIERTLQSLDAIATAGYDTRITFGHEHLRDNKESYPI